MLERLRIPGLGGWGEDPLWGSFYDWTVEHPQTGGLLWRVGIGSDLRRLYAAAAEIGRQPAGSAVLDVEPVLADVGKLPFADAEFDLVVSFTGLHCFPDPHQAVREMGRVLHPGGVLTGSAVLNDTGFRHLPMRKVGRFAGLLGPGATSTEVRDWLKEAGFEDVALTLSGAIGYFRGVKG
jgi:SAM-dependent methyltransferase